MLGCVSIWAHATLGSYSAIYLAGFPLSREADTTSFQHLDDGYDRRDVCLRGFWRTPHLALTTTYGSTADSEIWGLLIES